MRLIDLDAIMAQFPDADFDGDVIENTKAYPDWRIGIVGLINVLKAVPIIEQSEDCVSREALRQLICKNNDKYGYSERFHEFTEKCLQLPSVTPSIPDVENNFNLGYNCGYADAMNDIAESEG